MNTTDDRIRRLVIESLDAELGGRGDPIPDRLLDLDVLPGTARLRPARRAASLLAAAAVVGAIAVAAVADGALENHHGGPAGGPTGGVRVTCTSTADPGIGPDVATLTARASELAGHAVTPQVQGAGFEVTIPGTTTAAASMLCDSASLDLRPVIAPPIAQAAGSSDPALLQRLGFPVPTTASAYTALTSTQRARLDRALARAGCGFAGSRGPIPGCQNDPTTGRTRVMLLGPAVVTAAGISDARAVDPASTGSTTAVGWTVEVTLRRSAAQSWSAWTGSHNTGGRNAPDVRSCSAGSTPCGNWVAVVQQDRVLSVPVTRTPLDSVSDISGGFDAQAATALAAQLRNGVLPVPAQLESIATVR